MSERPETGPMKFGDDWTGVFIRGDNAAFFAMTIAQALELVEDAPMLHHSLKSLAVLLGSSYEGCKDPQHMLPFYQCQPMGHQHSVVLKDGAMSCRECGKEFDKG